MTRGTTRKLFRPRWAGLVVSMAIAASIVLFSTVPSGARASSTPGDAPCWKAMEQS
jgi:hypothetical protein